MTEQHERNTFIEINISDSCQLVVDPIIHPSLAYLFQIDQEVAPEDDEEEGLETAVGPGTVK